MGCKSRIIYQSYLMLNHAPSNSSRKGKRGSLYEPLDLMYQPLSASLPNGVETPNLEILQIVSYSHHMQNPA